MEIVLKMIDDADDWLTVAWLAAGPVLWALLVLLTATLVLSLTLWVPGPMWQLGALAVAVAGLAPVIRLRSV